MFQRWLRRWGIVGLCLGCAAAAAAREGISKGFDGLLQAVVRIDVRERSIEEGASRFRSGVGSGAIISPEGLVVTNAHVATPRAVEIVVTLANLERVGARLVGWDHWTDLALLQLDLAEVKRRRLTFRHAAFGDSSKTFPGQTVFAVGTPHGLTRTVTRGIISNTNRYFEDEAAVRGYETGSFNTWLQTDAAINPGNSGGPLVTEEGRIVGINSRAYVGAENLGFAIPSNVVRAVVAGLQKESSLTRSTIGLVPGALQDLEAFYSLATNTGMLVNSVDPGSPAAKAGLRGGDILLKLDGRPVDGRFPEQLPGIQALIAGRPVDSTLRLEVKRGANVLTFDVTTEKLESRVGEESVAEAWGLSLRKVSRAFARENQLADTAGFLVIGVQVGRPGSIVGLQPGDIVTKAGERRLDTLADLQAALRGYESAPAPVLLEILRNRRVALVLLKP